jgi:hypothetical protein
VTGDSGFMDIEVVTKSDSVRGRHPDHGEERRGSLL